MKHPLQTSKYYARYLYSERIGSVAGKLDRDWVDSADDTVPKPIADFIYGYWWNDHKARPEWFDLPGWKSFPHQIHPNDLHPLELVTYNREAMLVRRLIERLCVQKGLRQWTLQDVATSNLAAMRGGDLDQIVSYLQGSLDWWLRLAGPRILQNRELLKQLVAQELEIKYSLAWTLHSRLVLLRSLKTHFPMQEPQR